MDDLALTAERLDERAQELDRREALLNSLRLQSEASSKKVALLARDLDARDLLCYRLRRELDEREAAIAPRESALDAKEAELAGRRLVVEEQLSQLSEASDRLNSRSIELDHQAADIARRESELKAKADSVGVLLDGDSVVSAPNTGASPEPELPSPSKAPPPLPGSEAFGAPDELVTATDHQQPEGAELEAETLRPDTEPAPPLVEAPPVPTLAPAPSLRPHWMPG